MDSFQRALAPGRVVHACLIAPEKIAVLTVVRVAAVPVPERMSVSWVTAPLVFPTVREEAAALMVAQEAAGLAGEAISVMGSDNVSHAPVIRP